MTASPKPPTSTAPRASRAWWGVPAAALTGAGIWVLLHAGVDASLPARCPAGFVAYAARCCSPGQHGDGLSCTGRPAWCPAGMTLTDDGCVADPHTVRVGPGILRIGPGDWEAQGLVRPEVVTVDRAFWIDAQEVTWARWRGCVQASRCAALAPDEPGRPVRGITFLEAEAFCRYAGGRLPTRHEWQFAASGPNSRRYPWGDTGAVCRRASWGLASGPCGFGATGPDIAGIHVDGASPEGILDLAGGVAEWVVGPNGDPTTCGGSWRTSLATGLRTWRSEDRNPQLRWDDVGVRCCYDREP